MAPLINSLKYMRKIVNYKFAQYKSGQNQEKTVFHL